jgi:hypothetical protein
MTPAQNALSSRSISTPHAPREVHVDLEARDHD